MLLHNYPGYGDTSGPITAELVCQDALQLLKKLREPTQEIVLLGNSVGLCRSPVPVVCSRLTS